MYGRPLRAGIAARVVGLLVAVVVLATGPGTALAADPTVVAAGDIACDTNEPGYNGGLGTATLCRQKYTSDLLSSYDAIIPLGDNQYNSGSLSAFQNSYGASWGRPELKAKTYPVIGNHEGTSATGGAGYCQYFGPAAHCNSSGRQGGAAFYSWDIGMWHVVVLNSNCVAAGGCDIGSAQYTWLNQDLAQNPTNCTMAVWHHPRWSSGHDGNNAMMQPIWRLLYDKGVDLALSGHSHNYERFSPLDGDGVLNVFNGLRQFVVGTGGYSFTGLSSRQAVSEAGQNHTFGVLGLTLRPTSYDFTFVPESGKSYTDSGTGACRGSGASGDTERPSTPGAPTGTVTATTVSLSWPESTDNVGVAGYRVLRDGALVGSTGAGETSFQDTGLSPGTNYTYTVQAFDGANNLSPSSGALNIATTSDGTLRFAPTDDATIDGASPTAALGGLSRITVDSSPVNDLLLKFTVSGTGGGTDCLAITSAKLRLTVGNSSSDNAPKGGDFRAAVSSDWSESTVTYNTAPAVAPGAPTASITTPVALGTAYLVNVTPLVTGNGTFTIRATGTSSDAARYYSRNGNAASLAPQLQLTCSNDPEPPSMPGTPTGTATATTASLTWAASTDNVGVTGYRVLRGGTLVGTTGAGVTSFQDSGLSPGTNYSYTVQAFDGANNLSPSSGALSITTTSDGLLRFAPSDDATIDSASPTAALGNTSRITVDSSPVNDLLLKFTVAGTGLGTTCFTISSAKLRLTVGNTTNDNAPKGGAFRTAASSSWSESTVTYNTAPAVAAGSPTVSVTTPVALGTAYLVNVTPLVTGNGTFTIRAAGLSTDAARYYSRNGNAAGLAPELQISCG